MGRGGGGWPLRKVHIPNAFKDLGEYLEVFTLAMQEELQLNLMGTVSARYLEAIAKLGSGAGGRNPDLNPRDPHWRQKYLRKAGVAYYRGVSLIRAGKGRPRRNLNPRGKGVGRGSRG
ncbi:unnamed protein product, partial [Discosporangium mesarthrocarpum]